MSRNETHFRSVQWMSLLKAVGLSTEEQQHRLKQAGGSEFHEREPNVLSPYFVQYIPIANRTDESNSLQYVGHRCNG